MNSGYSLDSDEKVIREVQGHWFALVPVVVAPAILVVAGLAVVYIYAHFPNELGFIPASAITLLSLVFFLLAGAVFMTGLFVFRQNKLILTDKHVIITTQRGLFSRTVSQLGLARVQDVKAVRSGVLATIFNFGTIEIETAGEEENFNFSMAPHPQQLADECLSVHDRMSETGQVPTGDAEL